MFSCPRVIHCTWVYPVELYPPFFGYYFFNAMLLLLQMLHLYWAALIVHMFYKLLNNSVCLCVCSYVKVFPCVTSFLTELLSHPISLSLSCSLMEMTEVIKRKMTQLIPLRKTTTKDTLMTLEPEADPPSTKIEQRSTTHRCGEPKHSDLVQGGQAGNLIFRAKHEGQCTRVVWVK